MAAEITWALVLATTIHFFLGAIWYGPLFGKAWAKLAYGKEEIEYEQATPRQPSPCPHPIDKQTLPYNHTTTHTYTASREQGPSGA